MDKYIRDHIVDLIDIAVEGIVHIKNTDNLASINNLISDCGSAIVAIDASCVNGLSKERYNYYQQIFDGCLQSLVQLADFTTAGQNILEVCDLINELLQIAKQELKSDKEVKKEIVFLPYKASMWDSLESIWLAVKDDPQCEAIVMPIPYCDRKPNGEVGEWHCEANDFPNNVLITNYQDYDIAERRPDIIYFHNPYDGNNYVTSVHPAFYSSELKKHTDMLIYVPYFVTDGEYIAPHFCQTAGVLNADRVIVENEIIKEQYISNYPDQNANREMLEQKFLPLGSPKLDKVKRSKRHDFTLPEEWEKKLQGKKAVFYNTHLNGLIQQPEQLMKKMRYVFDIFKNRDDVVLWWRPHPLSKSTLQSMRPDMYDAYLKLEEEYMEADLGIYDTSADLYRAITWTDAYYGDISSVVWLYKATGKPVMIQNINIIKETTIPLTFEYMFLEDNNIWFISSNGKGELLGLFMIDLTENAIIFFGELPVDYQVELEYVVLGKINDKVVIAPYFSKDGFIEYDISENKFKKFDNNMFELKNKLACFCNVFEYDKSLFFIGNYSGLIVEYNSISKKYIFHTEWSSQIGHLIQKEKLVFGRHTYARYNSKIYLTPVGLNKIIELDLATLTAIVIDMPFPYASYNIKFSKGSFWITPQKGNQILLWRKEDRLFKLIEIPLSKNNQKSYCYSLSGTYGEIFLPSRPDEIFYIDNKNYQSRCLEKMTEKFIGTDYDYEYDIFSFLISDLKNNREFAFYNKEKYLVEFNVVNDEMIKHEIKYDFLKKTYLKSRAFQKKLVMSENECISMKNFLDDVLKITKQIF